MDPRVLQNMLLVEKSLLHYAEQKRRFSGHASRRDLIRSEEADLREDSSFCKGEEIYPLGRISENYCRHYILVISFI